MVKEAERDLTDVMNLLASKDVDGAWIRELNERTAIIQGLTEMLIDSSLNLDEDTSRAALEAIARHSAGLRELLKHD